jgi:hypothetical protein
VEVVPSLRKHCHDILYKVRVKNKYYSRFDKSKNIVLYEAVQVVNFILYIY